MGASAVPKTLHAYTRADRWLGVTGDRHLLPTGSEVGVILASPISTPEKLAWELKAIEISTITVDCLHYIAKNRILFDDADLHFDGGDFFGDDPPSTGDITATQHLRPQV